MRKLLQEVKTALKKYGYQCNLATRVRLQQVSTITALSGETIILKSTYFIRRHRAVVYFLIETLEAELLT
ncbi:hypothetical protein [Leptothoe sp. PORK10 BA2]|uniref:hypothetical protein n=1 Tax=Leptothoe sp. PORK10 BA2 TaxID=3110254 RepID=UPI002B1EA4DB|nr:hypothetical protein [Leptothoe sp. PORK10 BA2]MEA5464863.1 hypothetical protein [Leptothoe sp. PORK10 BA2]